MNNPTLDISKSTFRCILLYLFIFSISFGIRNYRIGITEYQSDQAQAFEIANRIVQSGQFPKLGIKTSLGFSHSPVTYYVLSLPLLISNSDPLSIIVFINLLNAIAVCLIFYIIKHQIKSVWIAVVISLLYSFIPLNILFSRLPAMIQFFTTLYIWSAYQCLQKNNLCRFSFLCFSFYALINIHLSGLFLIGGSLYLLYTLLRSEKNKCSYIFLLILISLISNYFYMHIFFSEYAEIVAATFTPRNFILSDYYIKFLDFFRLFEYYYPRKLPIQTGLSQLNVFSMVLVIIILAGLLFSKSHFQRFSVISFLSVIVLYLLIQIRIYIHYYLILIPFTPFLITHIYEAVHKKNLLKKIFNIFIICFIFLSIVSIFFFYNYIGKRRGLPMPHYGIVYEDKVLLAKIFKQLTRNENNEIFITSGLNTLTTLKYEEIMLLRIHGVQFKNTLSISNIENYTYYLVLNRLENNIEIIKKILPGDYRNLDPYYIWKIDIKMLKQNPQLFNIINNTWYINYIISSLTTVIKNKPSNAAAQRSLQQIKGIELRNYLFKNSAR